MTINGYQQLALRTANNLTDDELILNGALGLCGESGEVADIIKKYKFQGHELEKEKLIEELGDVAWYLAIMAEGLEVDLESVLSNNIEKLKRRYPNGFDVDKSVNREETWMPDNGEFYYYIHRNIAVFSDAWEDWDIDKLRFAEGNVFKTEEEARAKLVDISTNK